MAASKPLTTESIALTEKKMDMSLEDIIKMSKKPMTKDKRVPRPPIKNQRFLNGSTSRPSTVVQRFMDSRSFIRQGMLAQRRSDFRGNHFQLATNVARNAASMPVRGMVVNWNKPSYRVAPPLVQRKVADVGSFGKEKMVVPKPRPQTLDALFANMKEQRMRVFSAHQQNTRPNTHQMSQRRRARQQQQQRGGARSGRWYYDSAK